ncbi:MAG: hypothetical protein JO251_22400 [Verrucomicrobia bacterium]|nr:hypothetical protein [Verrucomicrobiota bacterium]
MNLNPSLTSKEQYGPKSEAWQEQQSPPIVRFWCDDGTCWAIPFFQVGFMHSVQLVIAKLLSVALEILRDAHLVAPRPARSFRP